MATFVDVRDVAKIHVEAMTRPVAKGRMNPIVQFEYYPVWSKFSYVNTLGAKGGDLIIADERVNFSIKTGLHLCKSAVVFFKHNDMQDLEAKLEDVMARDKKNSDPVDEAMKVASNNENCDKARKHCDAICRRPDC